MALTRTPTSSDSLSPPAGSELPPQRSVTLGRLRNPVTWVALLACAVGAIGSSLGTVLAGDLADHTTAGRVWLLALCVVGAATLDTIARTLWAGMVDRAEGKLRADLLDAAMHQPLAALTEQAVGEVLDRVDDDTHEVGSLLRQSGWMTIRTVLASGPLWIVAGLTWWPAFLLFPLAAVAVVLVAKPLLPEISRRKVIEEAAWTDHAAALEEGIAGRDDLRSALGQAHVVRRCAALAADVGAKFKDVLGLEVSATRRTGGLLHGVLAATAVVGAVLVVNGDLAPGRLVTLFLVTTMFVGQIDHLARQLPDLQAGFGAVLRLRQMLGSAPEPVGGRRLPDGDLDIEFRDLHFAYPEGRFALSGVDLRLAAGHTMALVGRTGSGKSTLASLLSRAVEPEPGSVFLGGVDVTELDLQQLRAAVGVVTQRTEILAGTLADNITLFAPIPRQVVAEAIAELSLDEWVAGLPDGLDTALGPGGTTLSSGEEQLVAFARLLVRHVQVVVLDEATARMDPVTEAQVVRASERLLAGRTGIVVAHRLSTTARAEQVAVLSDGGVIQVGPRERLATEPGPFADLLRAAAEDDVPEVGLADLARPDQQVGTARRTGPKPPPPTLGATPSLARGITSALLVEPRWGIVGAALFLMVSVLGAYGAVTGWLWGHAVVQLQSGGEPWLLLIGLVLALLAAPLLLAEAFWRYPRWWITVMLRARTSVLIGQTNQHRLERTPPGEVVGRVMDADRFARYADRWVDVINGVLVVAITTLAAGTPIAGLVLLAVMVASAGASTLGRRVAGRSAAAASTARAGFGRSLVSALDSIRTVKLAAATPEVHQHLREVDHGRVQAAVREHRVQALLDGVPIVMVQCGVVAAWAVYLYGGWGLATTLLVASAVNGFDWFGRVAGAAITEAPGTRAWMNETSRLAGGGDLMRIPRDVDLLAGNAPPPEAGPVDPLTRLELRGLSAIHDDGTIGIEGVDLTVGPGELVLLLGQVGSGKSSLLGALTGLTVSVGEIRWNGALVVDPQTFLRPGRVAYVAQVPRVLSGTFRGNVGLDHAERAVEPALVAARMGRDVETAGGPDALVGHRGVRLSGGQVQRLALARGLACQSALLLADDVSSALDAATEIELWTGLRSAGATVIGATSKRAALALADRVVIVEGGRVAEAGPWPELAGRWGHLAG